MARIAYESWNPRGQSLELIGIAEQICSSYQAQGYDLTLRQLYYQFVSRDVIPNNQRQYKMLGNVIDRARRAGYLDWNYIVDRTRNLMGFATYDSPADLIAEQEYMFHRDLWESQDYRIEVWVEKEALAGVIGRASGSYACDYFSCRGYVSQSEMHAAAKRHQRYERQGQDVVVLHLGDHDPSGIDMSRDIQDRLSFFGANTVVERIALNMDQVEEYGPPPNPAKLTDSRVEEYIARYGEESWELDALDPATLNALINEHIERYLNPSLYQDALNEESRGRDLLRGVSENWDAVADLVASL